MIRKILITVRGGNVTAVFTTLPECKVVIVDFDEHTVSDEQVYVYEPRPQDDWFEDGKAADMFDPLDDYEAEAAAKLQSMNY